MIQNKPNKKFSALSRTQINVKGNYRISNVRHLVGQKFGRNLPQPGSSDQEKNIC